MNLNRRLTSLKARAKRVPVEKPSEEMPYTN
jgi:hypothetical protein